MDIGTWFSSEGELKLLITDNAENGNRLVRRQNLRGRAVAGVTVTTSDRIAEELVLRDLALRGEFRRVRRVSSDTGALLLEGILREHPEQYDFVPRASICTATAAEILANLVLLRANTVTEAYRASGDRKTEQLNRLAEAYEKRLVELGFYDECMLWREGMRILAEKPGSGACVPAGLLYTEARSVLEEDFLRAYAKDAEILSFEKPECTPSWSFFRSYGIWNEPEYILEKIRRDRIPFGDVRIVYTSPDYEPALLAAFGERKVPLCFTSGRPVSGLNMVRMLLSLIKWAADGYNYEDLKSVILNPRFVLPAEEEGKFINGIGEFLWGIRDKIGWGLDRYKKFLAETEKTTHPKEYLDFLRDTVGIFDGFGTNVDPASVLDAMTDYAWRYGRRAEEDKIVLPLLREERKALAYVPPMESLEEALDLLRDRLEHLTEAEAEDPCAVAAGRIDGVTVLDRPYVFVIGLADRHYGEALIESPVLNDAERAACFDRSRGNVTFSADRAARRLQDYMKSLELSEIREIHLGYCFFDTVKQEELSPSALFLNLREKYGESEEPVLVEYPRVMDEDTGVLYKDVWHLPLPEEGEEAEEDVRAEVPVNEFSLSFSPSALDKLSDCPAQYSYRRIRHIPEEEYAVPDSSVWLSYAERGSFFHLIMERYIKEVLIGRDKAAADMDRTVFDRVFEEAVREMEKAVPVEAPATARQEREEVRRAADRYLTELHSELSGEDCPWQVMACELSFGFDPEKPFRRDYEYDCYEDGEFGDGTLLCRDLWHLLFIGCIDRVDGYVDGKGVRHYRIVDYKTGSFDNFKKYKKASTTQHHIYQMYMAESGTVDVFEYHFPFEEKEESRRLTVFEFEDPMRRNEDQLLRDLHDLYVDGNIGIRSDKSSCSYCSYSDICIMKIKAVEG